MGFTINSTGYGFSVTFTNVKKIQKPQKQKPNKPEKERKQNNKRG